MKIKTLLIVALSCFSIIPMIIISFFVVSNVIKDDKTNFENLVIDTTNNQVNNVGEYLSMIKNTSISLSGLDDIKAYDNNNQKAAEALASFADNNSFIDEIIIIDSSGKVIISSNQENNGINFTQYDKISDKAEGELVAMQIETSGAPKTAICVKQSLGSAELIVLANSDYFSRLYSGYSFANTGRIMIVDPYLAIIDNGVFSRTLSEESQDEYKNIYDAFVNKTDFSEVKTISYENSSVKRLAGIKSIPDTGWYILAVADLMDTTSAGKIRPAFISFNIWVGVLLFVGSIFVAIYITKPLEKIQDTLIRIRRGDHEARIDVMTNNEYGSIARSFNDLIDDIIVSEGRYRTIIEMSDSIIFEWNFKTNEVFFSNNFNKKFSYRPPSDHFGDSFLLKVKVHPEDDKRYREDLEGLSKGLEFKNNEYRFKNIYGDFIWVLIKTATLKDKNGEPIKVIGAITDIDREKKNEQLLTERASFDSLTQLYNRETVEHKIESEISLSTQRKSEIAILLIDIDDFKIYNDKYSHATGDAVLQFTAKTIQDAIKDFGFAGRFGGDEFVVCIRNAEINSPAKIAHTLLKNFEEGFVSDGETLKVKASIGIAVLRDANVSVEKIISLADDAMYKIKKSGKSNYGFI